MNIVKQDKDLVPLGTISYGDLIRFIGIHSVHIKTQGAPPECYAGRVTVVDIVNGQISWSPPTTMVEKIPHRLILE